MKETTAAPTPNRAVLLLLPIKSHRLHYAWWCPSVNSFRFQVRLAGLVGVAPCRRRLLPPSGQPSLLTAAAYSGLSERRCALSTSLALATTLFPLTLGPPA